MDIAEYATSQRSCMVGSQHLHKFAKQSMSTPLLPYPQILAPGKRPGVA